ncbi:LysR substrate-binding domain-containing protein [Streptomyces anulatus]|uniref:LysR substrate-binding domain-containing protein n=1 Tax=Streptomyces anulatus TaxID=1892 RepID=UPI0033F93557
MSISRPKHLYAEPFVLIHSERHPPAARPAVELTDTVTEAFIDFPQGWGNRGAIDALFAEHGLNRRVRTEVVAFGMALELVRSDLGIAFVPRSTVTDATGIRVRTVGDADVRWPVQLARSTARSLSAAGRVVSQAVLSHVHDGPQKAGGADRRRCPSCDCTRVAVRDAPRTPW